MTNRTLVLSSTDKDDYLLSALAPLGPVEHVPITGEHPVLRRIGFTSVDTIIHTRPGVFIAMQGGSPHVLTELLTPAQAPPPTDQLDSPDYDTAEQPPPAEDATATQMLATPAPPALTPPEEALETVCARRAQSTKTTPADLLDLLQTKIHHRHEAAALARQSMKARK